MRKILIPLCKNSTDRYHLNILRIISIVYHLYSECEWYKFAFINKPGWLYEQEFWDSTMGKWKDHGYFTRDVIYQYPSFYVNL